MLFIHSVLLKLPSVTYIVFFFLVFLNQSMVAFLDKDRTMPYQGMVAANIHSADCTCTGEM